MLRMLRESMEFAEKDIQARMLVEQKLKPIVCWKAYVRRCVKMAMHCSLQTN